MFSLKNCSIDFNEIAVCLHIMCNPKFTLRNFDKIISLVDFELQKDNWKRNKGKENKPLFLRKAVRTMISFGVVKLHQNVAKNYIKRKNE